MNAPSKIAVGSARAVSRRLPAPVDLLALYAQLGDHGRRRDTLMFETASGPSIIVDRAALRIECRGGEVRLVALTAGGETVLDLLAVRLADHLTERSDKHLVAYYDRGQAVDATERLFGPSPFDVLRAIKLLFPSESEEEPFTLCLLGVLGFDHVDLFEELPQALEDPVGFPDFVFWLAESMVVREPRLTPRLICTAFSSSSEDDKRRSHFSAVDRLSELASRAFDVRPLEEAAAVASEVSVDLDDDEFIATVAKVKEHILAGDAYQVVVSRTFSAPCSDPIGAFARLRSIDLSPYMFFVSMEDHALFGCSPETSVRVSRDGQRRAVEVKPIAGTRPRGTSNDED
ncbi:MAG TPA: chorismate-binding protein, partial [Sphingomicrobium sp.]|nr:chorismate-binding protein [Sphingomicrobium sp.]